MIIFRHFIGCYKSMIMESRYVYNRRIYFKKKKGR